MKEMNSTLTWKEDLLLLPSIIQATSHHVLERRNESLHLALEIIKGHNDNEAEIDFLVGI